MVGAPEGEGDVPPCPLPGREPNDDLEWMGDVENEPVTRREARKQRREARRRKKRDRDIELMGVVGSEDEAL